MKALPWWRRPGDVTAVALLIVLPALVFGVPALLGHAVLPGDDMTQNFPLRVLAGREIRSGHLPLFDAYSWSGAPLLAGWNAGAAYPLTWLFAVLPGVAAWTTGLVITWATAGTGLFWFLRALRLKSLPAFLGALSFALAGAMSAQVTHFSLVAGMSWVPVALLAVLRLSEPRQSFSSLTDHGDSPVAGLPPGQSGPSGKGVLGRLAWLRLAGQWQERRRQVWWTAVLAVAVGLIILAGEPRAIVDGCVAIGLYAVWRICRCWRSSASSRLGSWRGAVRAGAPIAAGCLLGLCLGAVQWLPGLAAINTSQRGGGSMALFASGSLPPRWLLLTLVPDLLGGSGSLSQPGFFASYNLTEVTSYVGILPLVAALVLLVRAVVARRPDGRRHVPEWVIWHIQAVVGIVLALGGDSPLATVLYRLPLFGSQRLQSRNILLLDLALAILLAYWLDNPFPERASQKLRASLTAGAGALGALAMPATGRAATLTAATGTAAGMRSSAGPTTSGSKTPGSEMASSEMSGAKIAPDISDISPDGRITGFAGMTRWRSLLSGGAGSELLAGLLAPLGIIVLVVLALTWGAGLLRWLGTGAGESARVIGRLNPWLAPYAVLAAGAIALVIFGRRLGRRWWARLCAGFVVTDIVIFTILGVVSVAPSGSRPATKAAPTASGRIAAIARGTAAAGPPAAAGSATDTSRVVASGTSISGAPVSGTATSRAATSGDTATVRPVRALGYTGRFAIYDPDLLDTSDLSLLGPPDDNVITSGGMPSVQGYSSIVDGDYATATGSHSATGDGQNVLSPAAVGNGTLDALDTTVLLTLPQYLTTKPGDASPAPGPTGTGRRSIGAGQRATWYLGQSVAVSRVTVPDTDAEQDAASGTEVGLTEPDGRTQWFPARAADASTLEISLARPVTATAVLGRAGIFGHAGGRPDLLGAPTVTLASGAILVADGQLQNVLVPPRWSAAGFDGGFAVYTDQLASGPLTVLPLPGQASSGRPGSGHSAPVQQVTAGGTSASTSVADASVRYTTSAAGDVTTATVSSANGVRLVRSMAAIPGWSATWQPVNGQPVTLNVQRDGVVQAVDVPPGQGTVTWHYVSPRFTAGLAVSGVGVLLTLLLAVFGRRQPSATRLMRRRRRQLEPQPT